MNQKVNDAVDKGIDNATKKKAKGAKSTVDSTAAKTSSTDSALCKQFITGRWFRRAATAESGTAVNGDPVRTRGHQAYSKFDFFPAKRSSLRKISPRTPSANFRINGTQDSRRSVTLNNRPGKWLAMKQEGVSFLNTYPSPDNFTFQVDLLTNNNISNISSSSSPWLTQRIREKFELTNNTSASTFPASK